MTNFSHDIPFVDRKPGLFSIGTTRNRRPRISVESGLVFWNELERRGDLFTYAELRQIVFTNLLSRCMRNQGRPGGRKPGKKAVATEKRGSGQADGNGKWK